MPVSAPAAATPNPTETANAFLSGPFGQYAKRTPLAQGGTANAADYLDAQRYAPRGRYEIVASSVIPADLITGIDSEAARIDLSDGAPRRVRFTHGPLFADPQRFALIGVYKNDVQTRTNATARRVGAANFPDTSSIDLHEQAGADTEGYAGLGGKVDTHIASAFGAVALSSIISAGLQLSQPKLNMTTAGIAVPSTGQIVAGAIGQEAAQIGAQLTQRQLSAPPTIHVPRGYPFVVVVDRDMVLPGPYGSGGDPG